MDFSIKQFIIKQFQLCTDDLVRRAKGLWLLGSLIPFLIQLNFNNTVLGFRVRSYRLYPPHGVDFNPNEMNEIQILPPNKIH